MNIHRMDSLQPPPEESGSESPGAESPESARVSASPGAFGKESLQDSPSGRDAAEPEPGDDRSPRAGDAVYQGRLMKCHFAEHPPADMELDLSHRQRESSAISSVRTLVSVQAMFYQGDLDQSGEPDYATELQPLGPNSDLIDEVLGEGSRSSHPMVAAPPSSQVQQFDSDSDQPEEAAPLSSQVRQTGTDSNDDDGLSKGTKKPGSS
ncbi:MAG TPA: hypothetical protein PKN61_12560 [Acidobacteriota bacterium]|jgi:hypothetical protein|nr:hypothetical protein [Acidobacteriota bacterium]HNU02027.1 hypothetical protein [Acidobacteriota bacterium]HPB29200.1 hypothetical protein [Acidobacteriota bacterium]HQP74926.1 hypothetical protein [Acidobacteriota bacterium]